MGDWKTPEGCKYTKTDDWIKVDGGEALVGITDYAQEQLSDIVFVELPEVGDVLDKGDEFGSVESVKAASELYMPAGGEVVAVNEALEDTPELVNSSPFADGWMMRIKLADPADVEGLLSAEAYKDWCEAQ